jgi:uncharacterized membrane protein
MSTLMHDIARAALPVAVALLILAVAARTVLWVKIDDYTTRLARDYVEPLASWCLIALMVYALARVAAGEGSALALALPLVLGVVALLALSAGEPEEQTAPVEPPAPEPVRPPVRAPDGSLWARRQ